MSELYIVVGVTAKQGKEGELRSDLAALVEPSRREEGNISYDLFEDVSEPRQFVFVEHWTSKEAQAKYHNHGQHILHFHQNGDRNVEARNFVHMLRRVT
ncbi:putative quinol monooxygenase [Hyphococcus sp.]|uniref:putative quinol monooxygenase n=1 Tax=Hyphococcus sp. TaxID=2038636 RepID=UPI002080DDD7|nr:MAG: antibiotic biosynthesis monooxygenase [Marinicaulis sp.]